jgi:beta-glucosidase
VSEEFYEEDIFVGYCYFDSFKVEPRFEFGFGRSYTDFSYKFVDFKCQGTSISINVSVTNTGSRFSGKEVMQCYISVPCSKLGNAYQTLAAFGKTGELHPGFIAPLIRSIS